MMKDNELSPSADHRNLLFHQSSEILLCTAFILLSLPTETCLFKTLQLWESQNNKPSAWLKVLCFCHLILKFKNFFERCKRLQGQGGDDHGINSFHSWGCIQSVLLLIKKRGEQVSSKRLCWRLWDFCGQNPWNPINKLIIKERESNNGGQNRAKKILFRLKSGFVGSNLGLKLT